MISYGNCFGYSVKISNFAQYVCIDSYRNFAYDNSYSYISEELHITNIVFCYLCCCKPCIFYYAIESSSHFDFTVPMQSAFYDGKSRTHGNRGECTELGTTCVSLYPCPYWDRDNLHGIVGIFLSETGGVMR